MPQNFIDSGCEQGFLLPPDVRDWLAADHLAWFVIDAVRAMDLAGFYAAYRADGHGRAAYESSMMVTLLMYAYATKQRSSRAIESHCRQDVAYRVITGNVVPDHATVARFVCRHEAALAELFAEVLKLCDGAGLVKPGLVAIDGTRLAGNASRDANREFEQIAREILADHKATDEAEDKISSTVMRVVMSCLSSCARRRVDASSSPGTSAKAGKRTAGNRSPTRGRQRTVGSSSMRSGSSLASRVGRAGCVTRGASSSSAAGKTRLRSHARVPGGCCSRASDWMAISTRSAVGTRRMRSIGPVGG
jgi:transposase